MRHLQYAFMTSIKTNFINNKISPVGMNRIKLRYSEI